MMRSVLLAAVLLASGGTASAQTAHEWVETGHRAAREDRHAEAISAWERALALQPSLRGELLASLGRQYLWNDDPNRAARLLEEFLIARGGIDSRSSPCDVRNDYGLALSWSDALDQAAAVLESVTRDCAGERESAVLRLALVRRWQDTPSAAEKLYVTALRSTDAATVRAARIGLAHVALMRGYDRRAREAFDSLAASAPTDADRMTALTGSAIANARLGESARVRDVVTRAGDAPSRDIAELRDHLQYSLRPRVQPSSRMFRDADGTTYVAASLQGSAAIALSTRVGADVTTSRLDRRADERDALRVGVFGEQRTSPALGMRADIAATRFSQDGWTPFSGQVHAVVTPHDRLRVDAAAARILVTDNFAMLENRVSGAFASLDGDVRLSNSAWVAAGADATRWSVDNTRTRFRFVPRVQLEGRPRVTLELPALLQLYDEPMPFAFFSPTRYVEAGPAANAYLRFRRHWNASLYGRAGAQRESERSWDPFGSVRASVWRDAAGGWTVRGAAAWSSSNLASTTGFRRTSLELEVGRAF